MSKTKQTQNKGKGIVDHKLTIVVKTCQGRPRSKLLKANFKPMIANQLKIYMKPWIFGDNLKCKQCMKMSKQWFPTTTLLKQDNGK